MIRTRIRRFDPARIKPTTGPLAELDALTRQLETGADALSKRLRRFARNGFRPS